MYITCTRLRGGLYATDSDAAAVTLAAADSTASTDSMICISPLLHKCSDCHRIEHGFNQQGDSLLIGHFQQFHKKIILFAPSPFERFAALAAFSVGMNDRAHNLQ